MEKEILTEAEKCMIDDVLNITEQAKNVQSYIKENFGIDSEFDEDTNTLHLKGDTINEAFGLATAKDYAVKTIGECVLHVVYDKK